MSDELSPEARHAVALEQRASEIRVAMYSTPGLLERLQEGYEASERGDVVTLDDFMAELDRLDMAEA